MEYEIITPPTYHPLKTMDSIEAETYFDWFIEQIPIRIALLQQVIRSSSGEIYRDWIADKSVDSLVILGHWFSNQVELRSLTENEINDRDKSMGPRARMIGLPETTLTEKSLSMAIDIGMYWGEVLCKNLEGVKWELFTGTKYHVDYQQPILTGFEVGYSCNPVFVAIGLAADFAWGKAEPDELRNQYYGWARLVVNK